MHVQHHGPCWVIGRTACALQLSEGLHRYPTPLVQNLLLENSAHVGSEELHEDDRENQEDEEKVPGRYHRCVKVLVKAGSGAPICGVVAAEIGVQLEPGHFSHEKGHEANAEEAEPQCPPFVGGGGVHSGAQDRDEPSNNSCHCSFNEVLSSQTANQDLYGHKRGLVKKSL